MSTEGPLLRHEIGSVFKKDYKGKEVVVKVRKEGYIYNGKPYRTLSAAVAKITGRPTPANVFFGLETTPRGEGKKHKKKAVVSNGHDTDTDNPIQEETSDTEVVKTFGMRFENSLRKLIREEVRSILSATLNQ